MMRDELAKVLPEGHLLVQEHMSRHTTMKVGGPADYYAVAENERELAALLQICRERACPFFLLGNGSNLLVSDEGYRGLIIRLGGVFGEIRTDGTVICAGGGALLSAVGAEATKNALSGMEWGCQIPGTLGGALRMNAGTYGGEMKDIVRSVKVMDLDGNVRTLSGGEMEFGYRRSILITDPSIVLGAKLQFQPGDSREIAEAVSEYGRRRREKQPLEYPSAGSTFKRPEGHFAGKLIQDAGLGGYRVGGAMVSTKHCGFVINEGHATAADVYKVITDVQKIVKDRTGAWLEPEVILLGEF